MGQIYNQKVKPKRFSQQGHHDDDDNDDDDLTSKTFGFTF